MALNIFKTIFSYFSLFIFFYVFGYFAYVSVCVPHECLAPVEV